MAEHLPECAVVLYGRRGPCTCVPAVEALDGKRVTLDQLDAQRKRGWPDFHPEDYCHRCGIKNLSWWTDAEVWNAVMRPDGEMGRWNEIVCPQCLAELFDERFPLSSWHVRLDPDTEGGRAFAGHTVAPDGSWVCGRCGRAPEAHAVSECVYDPVFKPAARATAPDPLRDRLQALCDAAMRNKWHLGAEAVSVTVAQVLAVVGEDG